MPGRSRTEADLHAAVARYLDAVLYPGVWWTSIGHGGFPLPIRLAAQLKRRGVKAGVPDVLIIWRGRAVWIELKRPKDLIRDGGRLSPAQRVVREQLLVAGCAVWIATSLRDVDDCLNAHQVPTRGKVAA